MENESPKQEIKQEPTIVESAYAAAEVLKAERTRAEEALKNLQKAQSLEILSGKSQGRPQEEPKKEETPEEYKNRVMKGLV